MSDLINPVAVALRAKLNTAAITAHVPNARVYWPAPPAEGRAYPYILLDCLDAPTFGSFAAEDGSIQVWAVRVVTQDDADQASTIAAAIQSVLENAALSITGHRSLCCYRRRAIPPRPVLGTDSVNRYHGGNEYNIGVGAP